jgi:hypothetical protein
MAEQYRQVIRLKDNDGDAATIVLSLVEGGTRIDTYLRPDVQPDMLVPSLLIAAHSLATEPMVKVKLLTMLQIYQQALSMLSLEEEDDGLPF